MSELFSIEQQEAIASELARQMQILQDQQAQQLQQMREEIAQRDASDSILRDELARLQQRATTHSPPERTQATPPFIVIDPLHTDTTDLNNFTPLTQTRNASPSTEALTQRVRPIFPDPEIFSEGSHEVYDQWRIKCHAKLRADNRSYLTHNDRINYIFTRTTGRAFRILASWMTQYDSIPGSYTTELMWVKLDSFFFDPQFASKSHEKLQNMKQGRTEFDLHYQEFQLALEAAGLAYAQDTQKIDYLRRTLNAKLLNHMLGYTTLNETYESYVSRARLTWDNMNQVNRLVNKKPLGSPAWNNSRTQKHEGDEMDWQSTPVGVARPQRLRAPLPEISPEEQERRFAHHLCLKCGEPNHRARHCTARRNNYPGSHSNSRNRQSTRTTAATIPTAVITELSDDDKAENA
jgi:hypothetical protein